MKKTFFLLLSLFPVLLLAQSETIVLQWDQSATPLHFPKALYADGENSLPYFSIRRAWTGKDRLPLVHITEFKSEALEEEKLPGAQLGKLEEQPLLEYELAREAGKDYLMIKVLPFIRTREGEVRRLSSFSLKTDSEVQLAPMKRDINGEWKSQSVLAEGQWYRIAVSESGIHQISWEELKELGISNPASVSLFGAGASQLPEKFSEGYCDDLEAVPLYFSKGSDGVFGPGDQLLFYAQGPVKWDYDESLGILRQNLHPYSWKGYYFISESRGQGPSPETCSLSTEEATHTVSSFNYCDYIEKESYNLIGSGREWYGDLFGLQHQYHYAFQLPEMLAGEEIRAEVKVAARSNVASSFTVEADGSFLGSIQCAATNRSSYTAIYAFESRKVFSYLPSGNELSFTLSYNRPDPSSEGWLNYICINGRSPLSLRGDALAFRDIGSAGPGNITEFVLNNASSSTVIWDVSNPGKALNVPFDLQGNQAIFRLASDELREFVAFDANGSFPKPEMDGEGLGPIGQQNLHGLYRTDLVIIAPEEFLPQAEKLAAHRRDHDGLLVEVVPQQAVFNEFSSGTPDICAIRNFMKMFYDRCEGGAPLCRYLLLFGDGSYDNRNHTKFNPNCILTYQSANSLSPTQSFTSDDFYGLLDTDESMYSGMLDIGIGRLPVSDTAEAAALVDKLTGYDLKENRGAWQNRLCFIGDDEDANIHMRQANELAEFVEANYPGYNINKVFLDAYTQKRLATGFSYPEVTRAINDQVSQGALIVNYTGHGGTSGLAHEQILTKSDINAWNNSDRLPLFMTATCEFSRYDDYNHLNDEEKTSAGELILLNPEGGGIALFTTTRLVYSGPNHVLNERFYELIFEKDEQGSYPRMGDVIIYAKNNTGSGINKRNFTLLGDPSMRLVYPTHRVVTDTLNGLVAGDLNDTLSAFEWVSVSGHIENESGQLLDAFNGEIYPLVFDKEQKVETLANDGDSPWSFEARNSTLYSGRAAVVNGRFSFGFYVPKDINYAVGKGKISYYALSPESDAQGYHSELMVGGIGSIGATDNSHPEIELYMNDTLFRDGGITDPHPVLLARVRDNFGINTSGNGIGHDITATLDDDRINTLILNNFFQADINSHNTGSVVYPYRNLEAGTHEIRVKIWDIHNNSSEASIHFVVVDSEEMVLEQLFTYPNPFTDRTWFNIAHNMPGESLELELRIYSLEGELVRLIRIPVKSSGYRLDPLEWDGRSEGGAMLGGGLYLYRVTLSGNNGLRATDTGKLIIAR